MERLLIDPKYQPVFARLGWRAYDNIACEFVAPDQERRGETTVRRGTIPGTDIDVFFKEYAFPTPAWRFIGRPSKARREFDNYGVFARLGIPAAERIACAEERDTLGRLKRAFILTLAVSRAQTLTEFFRVSPTREQRLCVCAQLAGIARQLHSADF